TVSLRLCPRLDTRRIGSSRRSGTVWCWSLSANISHHPLILLPFLRHTSPQLFLNPNLLLPGDKLDVHAVGSLNECDTRGWIKVHGLECKCDPLPLEAIAETIEIVLHLEAKVIHTPLLAVFFTRLLTCPLATHDDGGTVECDENLRGTTQFIASGDFAPTLSTHQDAATCGSSLLREKWIDRKIETWPSRRWSSSDRGMNA